MIVAGGRVSSGHLNPAVTIGYWVTHRLGTIDTVLYWTAQLGGAILAAYLLRYVVPEETWRATALGTPDLASGVTRLPGMLLEGVMAFFLIFVMFAIGLDGHGIPRPVGPAVAANHWSNHAVYWIGPLAGGVIGAWVSDLIFLGTPKEDAGILR